MPQSSARSRGRPTDFGTKAAQRRKDGLSTDDAGAIGETQKPTLTKPHTLHKIHFKMCHELGCKILNSKTFRKKS